MKRIFDVLASGCGLLVLSPIFLILAIWIKLDSKGPVLFWQKRVGINKKTFMMPKFRTMRTDAPANMPTHLLNNPEVWITRVGKVLRKASLDELPQMFNILNGTMAIIGPRPILDFEFQPYINNTEYCKRYEALPGMFCTVDLELRATADRETQFEMDAEYVRNMSLLLDIKTFLGVIRTVVLGKNVYKEDK